MAMKDLNIDIGLDLTRDEKEALVSKKMEMIRKKNEAILERHKEVQADKKKFEDAAGQSIQRKAVTTQKTTPPQVEEQRQKRVLSPPRQQRVEEQRQKRVLSPPRQQHQHQNSRPATHNRPQPQQGGRGRGYKERPKSQGFRTDGARAYEPIVDMADLDTRFKNRAPSPSKPRQVAEQEGPPPDPAYNYLADRTRDTRYSGGRQNGKPSSQEGAVGHNNSRGGKDSRRHPRNFGGQDFNNVKTQMKGGRDKEWDRRSYPPRNHKDMTEAERVEYEEWRAARHRVDQERMDRQKTASGDWRRPWDQEKVYYKDHEEPAYSKKTEPVKRPVGRIGSGRFDRGDHDDRRAEGQSAKAPGIIQATQPTEDRKAPGIRIGRGRSRGRGHSQPPGGQGEKPPRPKTWAGGDDGRTVECANDNMLVVKIDNTRGSDNQSVEVEYGPDEEETKKRGSGQKKRPRRSPTKQKHRPHQFEDTAASHPKANSSSPKLVSASSQDSSNHGSRPASLSQSISVGSTDEWEDMTGTDTATTEDEGEALRRGLGKLNPEAPIFLPLSPELGSPPPPSGFSISPRETRISSSPASSTKSNKSSGSLPLETKDAEQFAFCEEALNNPFGTANFVADRNAFLDVDAACLTDSDDEEAIEEGDDDEEGRVEEGGGERQESDIEQEAGVGEKSDDDDDDDDEEKGEVERGDREGRANEDETEMLDEEDEEDLQVKPDSDNVTEAKEDSESAGVTRDSELVTGDSDHAQGKDVSSEEAQNNACDLTNFAAEKHCDIEAFSDANAGCLTDGSKDGEEEKGGSDQPRVKEDSSDGQESGIEQETGVGKGNELDEKTEQL